MLKTPYPVTVTQTVKKIPRMTTLLVDFFFKKHIMIILLNFPGFLKEILRVFEMHSMTPKSSFFL